MRLITNRCSLVYRCCTSVPTTILMFGPPHWQLQILFFMEHVIYYIMYFFFLHGTSYNLLFSMIIYWSGYLCANYHSHVRSPTSAIAIFFSLEHVINYVVLSCIFFLHATCNILFSTQSKGVHNCNIGRAL